MTTKRRLPLLLGAFAGATLIPACALAQDAQTDRLQQQVNALQNQLQTLQKEIADSKKASQSAGAGAYAAATPKALVKAPPAPPIKMTWGGFLAAETVYRQRNTVSDMGTPFTSIPYPFSPQYDEHEFHGSARASRLSLLVEGQVDPAEKLTGYYEMDFLGVGVTSNYNQSNSWAPRVRQAFFSYDNSDWGWHLMAGQGWSMATQNTVRITPRKENVPLTIEANYVAGFDYTRNWQIRMVKDFGSTFAVGLSLENPAEQVYTPGKNGAASFGDAIANGGTINGMIVNWANNGNSFLSSGGFAQFNTETAPDIIGKAAFDPGWGHYELVGLVRFFTDNVFTCSLAGCPATTADVGSGSSKVTVGEGVGGSVLLPIVPKALDVQASVMYGKGIGRYGASQLPDVVVASDGTLSPITALHVLAGAVVHATPALDIYGYGGFERADSDLFSSAANGLGGITGFGNPNVTNVGCGILTGASFTGGTTNCAAINKEVDMVTVGFWQNLLKGSYGRVAAGMQYEYIKRKSFDTASGLGGVVSTDDNVFLTSLRYYPF